MLDPHRDCDLCPRLHKFIAGWRKAEPAWFNAPVPVFMDAQGPRAVRLLIVGLAPGLRGANRTGRPFTGDFAGDLLYRMLSRYHFSYGTFAARADDGLSLKSAAIVNAVRCVPPENKPTGAEIAQCRQFLTPVVKSLPNLAAILTLGRIAHDSTLRAFGKSPAFAPFAHGAVNTVDGVAIISSYHCSRYNTNTGRLTEAMFDEVFAKVAELAKRQIDRAD
jgi:uracil-DNA glycosylase family 4